MTNQSVIDELNAVCNSLGKVDENDGTYMKDRDCKPCLREMLRYLNSDSKNHTARCTLGSLNIIKSDLIPLIVQYCDYNDGDSDMFGTILRLCTNLTSSVLILFEQHEVPNDPEELKLHNKLLGYLYKYKEAFATDEKIWSTLNVHLRHNNEEEVTFERLIILIRNILHIPVDSTGDLGIHSDFDIHELCLYRMEKSGLLTTIIEIASQTQKGTEYCLHIMEIIYLMLRDHNPETIALAKPSSLKRKLDEGDVDKKRLRELAARDRREKLVGAKFVPSRFRTASSFIVKNYRATSGNPLIIGKLIESREALNFDAPKTEIRKAKNKKPLSSETSMVYSDRNQRTSKVSYSLKVFCTHFVEKTYSNYMLHIKNSLIQKKAQENDESYYLWAIQFFTAFTRHLKLPVDNISETLSTSSLHFIQILISGYQDKLEIEKKKFSDVSKRLHLALRAYREVLILIKSIDSESPFARTVETIQRNIFTETEYSTILLNLFKSYSEPKHSEHYVKDLVLTNHIFLELLEEYSNTHAPVEIDDPPEQVDLTDQSAKRPKKSKKKAADFRTAHFMTRYCCPDVIRTHLQILKAFKTNEDQVNEAILKLFERIVFDCKNDVILFQASVFRCLIDIMSYHSTIQSHERFKTLGNHLMEAFGAMANKKRWMYQELLFWKSGSDAIDIDNAINPPAALIIPDPLDEDYVAPELDPENDIRDTQQADSVAQLMAELDGDFSDVDSLPELDDDDSNDRPLNPTPVVTEDAPSQAGSVEDELLLADLLEDSPSQADLVEDEPSPAGLVEDEPSQANSVKDGPSPADLVGDEPSQADSFADELLLADLDEDAPPQADPVEDAPPQVDSVEDLMALLNDDDD